MSASGTPRGSELSVERTPGDPADFDVFRAATAELWGGNEEELEEEEAAAALAVARGGAGPGKEQGMCGLCRRRFAVVSCGECRSGYCLRCMMRISFNQGRGLCKRQTARIGP